MNGLTAADFADTGQWRLIIRIFDNGMSAHLENTLHPGLEPQVLFSSGWDRDPENLLRNIENAVYDHPRVLEDFSAKVILYDARTVFAPTEYIEESAGAEETLYSALYSCEGEDVMTDSDKDVSVVYCPGQGIRGFLNRTFPGARFVNNLMELLRELRRKNDGQRLGVSVRNNEADFVLMGGDGLSLLSASTHRWNSWSDIVYHAVNILEVYDCEVGETAVTVMEGDIPAECLSAFTKLGFKKITINENNKR